MKAKRAGSGMGIYIRIEEGGEMCGGVKLIRAVDFREVKVKRRVWCGIAKWDYEREVCVCVCVCGCVCVCVCVFIIILLWQILFIFFSVTFLLEE